MNVEEIGAFIAQARKEQGISQEKLAEITGYPRRTICNIEKGEHAAHLSKIVNILEVLGYEIQINAKLRVFTNRKNKEA